jgi:hypothetical protein
MAEHMIKLSDAEETYLTSHGSTFEGIIDGLRVEWARAMASEAKAVDFETWQKVKDSEVVRNAVEVELGAQAEAVTLSATSPPEEPK